ncbi:DNA-binding protein EMBP-1-like isoform X1 [Phragmites australis]|uniref:DNA-binding protein EMBP-1-like isoform X1 n=1 Tax=Phragmites australis TaxID=29695 RepID=UPI002D78FD12|nr:DNA-binding protein EMBP-1-like isoform X1 [Phragmites australis]
MASSDDEQPKPPEPPAAAAPPQSHAEWAASLHAYYAAAGHPYAWPAQHLMAAATAGTPYGAPVPFPVYHPAAAAAYYAHASMAAGVPYPTSEAVAAVAAPAAEGKGKGKGGVASPEKGSYGAPSGEDASRSGDSGSEESSGTRDDDTDHKGSPAHKKRKSGNTSAEGEPSHAAVVRYAAVESPYPVKGRSASKLPVSAPGRAALPNATPNLNIGIDLWSASPTLAVPAVQGEASPGLALARLDGVAHLDERELKRERRKQSNRESARRSRLRKQQECEELAKKVAELTTENNALRAELDNLKKACEDMEAENSRLVVPSVTTTLGMSIEAPKAQQHDDEGQLHKNTSNNSNGNYVGGSHKQEVNTR